jgi:adenylate cyclase, class 1
MGAGNRGDGEIDFRSIKHRFMLLNKARLKKAQGALNERQGDMLTLLPLLFHANHPLLPGYINRDTPVGVWGYEPDALTLNLAKALTRSFSYRRSTRKHYALHAIYFMGSTGTIAHSEGSDFDFWLCHDPELKKEQLQNLQQKAQGIEKWAKGLGLEIHFFFVNPEEYRQGKHHQLTSEDSGSTQHNLLLDEFYRTSVLVAGQFPLWWLVPPEYESSYDGYVAEMQRKRFLYARDCLDFGGINYIPAEEFFGAALWQISKGVDAPYKSILKLLLVEAYASEYPAMELLSTQLKEAVYANRADPDRLDPYMLMLDKVSNYLAGAEEKQRLQVARRCFYYKTGIRLSDKVKHADWRRELLLTLVDSWGWEHTDILLLDAAHTWKVDRVLEERQALYDALIASYQFLSDFVRRNAGLSMISQHDLNILGRKLYTTFERKAGKVDLINRGIDANLHEDQVTLYEACNQEGEAIGWHIYRGALKLNDLNIETPIKRKRGLVELLAWCYLNKVVDEQTGFAVHSSYSRHTPRDIRHLLQNMIGQLPLKLFESTEMEDFSEQARLMVNMLYLNAGVRTSEGMLTTRNIASMGQTDPFSHGHRQTSLVLSLDHLQVNSWREVLVQRYVKTNTVLDSLCNYLKWFPRSAGTVPEAPKVYAIDAALGSAAGQRVVDLFSEVIALFYDKKYGPATRYVVSIGRSHYLIEMADDVPHYVEHTSMQSLIQYLGHIGEHFHRMVFDKRSLKESFLPLIYSYNKVDVVQFFFHRGAGGTDVFVLDEKGALFSQRYAVGDSEVLLAHFMRFFAAIGKRVNFMPQGETESNHITGEEYYELSTDALGRHTMEFVDTSRCRPGKQFYSLQVLVELNEKGESVFTLYGDGKEFSTLEYGNDLFRRVVSHVLEHRREHEHYPIYITDISLDRAVIGDERADKLQTVRYLEYKRRIEEQINRYL